MGIAESRMGGSIETGSRLAEHSLVRLAARVDLGGGRVLPAGAVGAVVGVWADGTAYEVEFSEPFHAVATVSVSKLAEVPISAS
jgi:Domain of unknown function (DUF4926)